VGKDFNLAEKNLGGLRTRDSVLGIFSRSGVPITITSSADLSGSGLLKDRAVVVNAPRIWCWSLRGQQGVVRELSRAEFLHDASAGHVRQRAQRIFASSRLYGLGCGTAENLRRH
jgi:hypothetical protein